MASSSDSARLQYLNDSSYLLATWAPHTSAYLMSRFSSFLSDNDLERSEARRAQACGACGNIAIPGLTPDRKIRTSAARKSRKDGSANSGTSNFRGEKVVSYNCKLCGRQTKQTVPTSPRSRLKSTATFNSKITKLNTVDNIFSAQVSEVPTLVQESGSNSNINSRKRAKTRRQAGLQSLLAKKQEADSKRSVGSYGLDLMDFLKKE